MEVADYMAELRQSRHYASYMKAKGWDAEQLPSQDKAAKIFVYVRKLGILPVSVAKIQRFSSLPDFEALKNLVNKRRIISLTLEPGLEFSGRKSGFERKLIEQGFRPSRWPFLPTRSIRTDLEKTGEDLLSDTSQDARRSIKKASRVCEIKIHEISSRKQCEEFWKFFKKNGKGPIPGFKDIKSLMSSFGKNAFLVLAEQEKQLVSGALILAANGCAYYYWAANSKTGRDSLCGYLVVWESMLEAKKRGCRLFDMEGIYDPRFPKLKAWKGFTTFKKKFGGKVIDYPKPMLKYYLPKLC